MRHEPTQFKVACRSRGKSVTSFQLMLYFDGDKTRKDYAVETARIPDLVSDNHHCGKFLKFIQSRLRVVQTKEFYSKPGPPKRVIFEL